MNVLLISIINLCLAKIRKCGHPPLVRGVTKIFANRTLDLNTPVLKFREGDGSPLQYPCLENPMDRGAWWATVHGVAESQTRLSGFAFTFASDAFHKIYSFVQQKSQQWPK